MSDVELATKLKEDFDLFKIEISKVIIGQDEIIKNILISTFCGGHCLLVGVPGLAKTLLVQTFSKVLGLDFKRIQFTPDLMPSDIIGSEILNDNRKFIFHKGPIFANIILADEINRTPPKTQAALLEAMQEKSVTAAGLTHKLPNPFFVLATQNPIEQEGTYPLPEAQLDRFMFHLNINYPSIDEEVSIVNETTVGKKHNVEKVFSKESIIGFQDLVYRVPISDNVVNYAVKLAASTRPNENTGSEYVKKWVEWGAGPRASQYLVLGAKAKALLNGRPTPSIEDIQSLAPEILRHRILPNFNAEAEGIKVDDIVNQLIQNLED